MRGRARIGGERDEQLAVAAADSRRHLRIVIALPAQQRGEQFGILARAPVELRGVGGIAVMRLQRREFVETLAPQRQLGRASCRGRVCHYVSISVVAVRLTKKEDTRRGHMRDYPT